MEIFTCLKFELKASLTEQDWDNPDIKPFTFICNIYLSITGQKHDWMKQHTSRKDAKLKTFTQDQWL